MAVKRGTRQLINIWGLTQCYVQDHALVLGSENTATLSGWIRSRSIIKLATCSSLVSLTLVRDPELIRTLLQIEAFFKKNSSIDAGFDTTQVATDAFMAAERICKISNRRLDYYLGTHPERLNVQVRDQINRAREYIQNVLGPFEVFFKDLPRYIRISSGATALSKKVYSAANRRLKRSASTTGGCWPYADAFYSFCLPNGSKKFRGRIAQGNRILFVYKSFKTKRTIACEPEANSAFQLAFDCFAKARLTRKGQDLACQERNQHAALIGSQTGEISTEDFRQASDTVCKNVVAGLFDPSWYNFLVGIRSGLGILPSGQVIRYEKFSSMGNGSTFTIETLIFAACAYAVGSKTFNVYGDDVTIETDLSEAFRKLTRFLGFTINVEKSYNTGYYRESCGKHYVSGHDVTPFFLRSLKWHSPNLCHMINGLTARCSVNSQVFQFLRKILRETQSSRSPLPVVPVVEDTCKGICTTIPYAEKLAHLRWIDSIPIIEGNTPRAQISAVCHGHVSFWLWLLMKEFRHEDGSVAVGLDEYTRATGRYKVRKSVWRKPDGNVPDYIVADFLLNSLD